ncbi:MAG TPA: hypothetical protein VMP11_06570 [Verrucomicrobiae bacterium]|nr:hypothetical protein [Verrucomicrobiae bacterium]
MKPRKRNREKVDILILHGMTKQLVEDLEGLFKSLGISAATVIELPTLSKTQERKVDYYIQNCGTPLVLATFDESEPDSVKARPNVYDEIARCRRAKRKDTIVLQERRNGEAVEIPTNVVGQLVVIPFERDRLLVMFAALMRELKPRYQPRFASPAETTVGSARIVNAFLDDMDRLWDHEFDAAWDNVHRLDYTAESNFALALDDFFQQYQRVFSAMIRSRKSGDELRAICDTAYAKAEELASHAWEVVAEAKIHKADERLLQTPVPADLRAIHDKAAAALRRGKRAASPKEKIECFRLTIQLIQKFMLKEASRGR